MTIFLIGGHQQVKYKFAPLLSLLIFQGVGVQKFTRDVPKLSFKNWVKIYVCIETLNL